MAVTFLFIHSFIPLFSVDLLQDVEIVMFPKVQEREENTVAYSTHMYTLGTII